MRYYKLIGITLPILLTSLSLPQAHAQEVVYVIRHAEQMKDVEDPPLTDVGHRQCDVGEPEVRHGRSLTPIRRGRLAQRAFDSRATSASTISRTSSWNEVRGFQPSSASAFE